MTTMRNQVRVALQALCNEQIQKDRDAGIFGLFHHNFTAKAVAERAGCSETTARRWLDDLSRYRGYVRRRVQGCIGYRYIPDLA